MTSPLEWSDEPLPDPERRRVDAILAQFAPEFEGSPAAALAPELDKHDPVPYSADGDDLVPVVHDGGRLGRALSPHLPAATAAVSRTWRWAPAGVTTTGYGVAALTLPLPPPLLIYGAGLTGYAWWHCCGRPGPLTTLRLVADAFTDAAAATTRFRHLSSTKE